MDHPAVVEAHSRLRLAQAARRAGHGKANRAAEASSMAYDARQDRDNWQVRADVFEECERVSIASGCGTFEVDACAAPDGANAMCDRWWSLADSCTDHDWAGLNIWCNMPYEGAMIGRILEHFLSCWERAPYTTSATFALPEWQDQAWHGLVSQHFRTVAQYPAGAMLFSRPPEQAGQARVYVGPTRWPVIIVAKARLPRPEGPVGITWGRGSVGGKPIGRAEGGDAGDEAYLAEGSGHDYTAWLPDGDAIASYSEEVAAYAGVRGISTAGWAPRQPPPPGAPPVPKDVPSDEEQRAAVRRCLKAATHPQALLPEDGPLPSEAEFVARAQGLMLDEVDNFVACRPSWHGAAWDEALLHDEEQGGLSKAERGRSKMVLRWLREGFSLRFRDAGQALPEKRDKTLAMLKQQGYSGGEAERLTVGDHPPPMEFRNLRSALTHKQFMTSKVEENQRLGIIREWDGAGKPAIVNPMGVVEGTKLREILHGGYVSLWLDSPTFKYETIRDPMRYIRVGDHLFTVDAKSGYYHIPVERQSQTYLGFQWEGRYYVYCALPFGIGPACWVYTQVMAAVLRPLRRRGWLLSSYIDDSIYTAATLREALGKLLVLVQYMAALGFHLSRKKCMLWPGHKATHLGKVLDTQRLWVGVPQDKLDAFVQLVQATLAAQQVTPRQLARVAGKLISFMPAVTAAPLFVRSLYLRATGAQWDESQVATPDLVETLSWLATNINEMNGATWAPPAVAMTVKVDAGEWGYGLTVESGPHKGMELRGTLPDGVCGASSTHREDWAYCAAIPELLLSRMGGDLRGQRLQLVGDNQGAISNINKMGMRGDPQATGWIRALWQACHQAGVSLTAVWRPREMLQRADEISKAHDAADWSLARGREVEVWGKMGCPTLDPLADDYNNIFARDKRSGKPTLPAGGRFFAKDWVPGASGMDGLQQDWATHPETGARELAWVFPPLPLVGQTLALIAHQRADAIIILPVREDKWWWGLVQQLPVVDRMELPGAGLFTQGKRAAATPEHAKPFRNRWRAIKVVWD